MATLYVSEFAAIGPGGPGGPAQVVSGTPLASQTVAIGGSSTASTNAFGNGTRIVRVHADVTCSIAFGASPTAVATALRMAANQTEYFSVNPGDKIAVISNTYAMMFGGLGVGLGRLGAVVSTASYDADASALMARMTTPPTSLRAAAINTLVVALKDAGVWAKLDVLYVFAAADAQAARLNWKSSSYTATPVNSPTFTADRGYQGDGASSYLDSNFNPATAGGLFVQDSGHIGVWSRTNVQQSAGDIGSTNSFFTCRSATDTFSHRVNGSGTLNTAASSVTDSTGHFVSSRTLSASCRPYRNGSSIAAEQTLASVAPDSNNIRVLGRGGTVQYSGRQIAASHIGSGLSAAEIAAMYTPVLTYMQSVGAA